MPRFTWFFVCLFQIVIYVNSEGYYSVVAPGTIRSNSNYHVSVSTQNTEEPAVIQVGIKGSTFTESKEVEIPPNSAKLVEFKLPVLKEGEYNLTAKGISGLKFENETKLQYEAKDKSIFIQTDKATYKPGDLVRFRVLILDPNTRPAKLEQPVDITITDSADNRIKQFKDVKFTNGVYSNELQLSPFPVLGNWILEVVVNDLKEIKTFEIAKYVLPKFEATIEAPKHVLKDGILRVTVRAKYTYGKPVKGEAKVSIQENSYWRPSEKKSFSKVAPLDGKAHVEFDVSELGLETSYYQEVLISATVEEKLTGNKINATTTTNVHKDKYRIDRVDVPYAYVPDKPFKVTVAVKNYDDTPVQDTKNPVKFTLTLNNHRWYHPNPEPMRVILPTVIPAEDVTDSTTIVPQSADEPFKEIKKAKLDENGMAYVEFTIPSDESDKNKEIYKHYQLMANYLDVESYITGLSKMEELPQKPKEDLELKVLNEKLKLGDEVSIKVQTKEPLKYYVYQVVARGNIIDAGRAEVAEGSGSTEQVLKFKSKFEMVPQANVYVYFIKDGNLTHGSVNLDFENQLENSIEINTPEKAKPGEEIDITVTTDPDSYVGLLGVDQSVLLLKSGNDLKKDAVFREISQYRSNSPHFFGYGRAEEAAGLITLTNAHSVIKRQQIYEYYYHFRGDTYPLVLRGSIAPHSSVTFVSKKFHVESKVAVVPQVRKEFPETWICDLAQDKNGEGKIQIHKKVPDTITSWVLTGFSLNPKTGLGLTETPRKFKVFQPFFVSINLPYSVKRGEVINVPVAIFNYLDKNLEADVTLDNSQKEFEFAEAINEINEVLSEDVKRSKRLAIPANSGESVSFLIRPKKVGHVTLKLTATTPISGDAIEQILLVEPEGVTQFKNKAIFIDLTKNNEYKQDVDIEIPEDVVPDSVYSEISVVGDLLGPVVKNLDGLVRMPYGCGEQNMVNFVPNILVLRYLEGIKKLTPAIEEKAKKYLEIGYQRELTYKHPDGSYSAFGTSDKSGSTWLTAYVARSFRQAAKYTQIDEKVIVQALQFLTKTQEESGKFTEVGHVIDHSHEEDGKGIFLTAFTLLAFLENREQFPEYDDQIKKGLNYLDKNIDADTKQYPLAIATYALQLAKHKRKDAALDKLNSKAKANNDRKYWSEEVPKKKDDYWWGEPPTSDIETTSYALLSILENEVSGDEVVPILKWLVSKRNSLGGYYSTQATVVGLQALIKFSEKFGSTEKGDIDINFTDDQDTKGKITINDENSLLLQTHVLPPKARHISFTATGKGATLAQVSYRYNVDNATEEPRFKLEANVKESNSDALKLDVCTSFIPNGNEKESNMAVMEVSLPSGYVADADNLKALESVENVKKIETKKGDTVIVIYFDSLHVNNICPSIEALRTHKIGKQKPASIVVYDYYDSTRQARIFYQPPKSSLCDVCEGDDCGSGCKA